MHWFGMLPYTKHHQVKKNGKFPGNIENALLSAWHQHASLTVYNLFSIQPDKSNYRLYSMLHMKKLIFPINHRELYIQIKNKAHTSRGKNLCKNFPFETKLSASDIIISINYTNSFSKMPGDCGYARMTCGVLSDIFFFVCVADNESTRSVAMLKMVENQLRVKWFISMKVCGFFPSLIRSTREATTTNEQVDKQFSDDVVAGI